MIKKRFNKWLYRIAKYIIVETIYNSENRLTPQYLIDRGWVQFCEYYHEPNVKDRDRISISFEGDFYRVWHSEKLTFVALESTVEWFEMFYLLPHPDNRNEQYPNL